MQLILLGIYKDNLKDIIQLIFYSKPCNTMLFYQEFNLLLSIKMRFTIKHKTYCKLLIISILCEKIHANNQQLIINK